jgi:hypothetical protein
VLADPTFEELSATIARYPDPDDKLTIALGNFNRVRGERDAALARLAETEEALRQYKEARREIEEVLDESAAGHITDASAVLEVERHFMDLTAALAASSGEGPEAGGEQDG